MSGIAMSWPVELKKGLAGKLVDYLVRVQHATDPTASGEAVVPVGNHNLVLPAVAVGHYKVYVKGRDANGNDTTEEWMAEIDVTDDPDHPNVEAPIGLNVWVIP